MFRHLLESQPRRVRARSSAALSLVVHAALVGTAVAATKSQITPDDPSEPMVHVTYVKPVSAPEPPAPRRAPEPQPATPEPAPSPVPPLVPPIDVPTSIPAPNPNAAPTVEPTFYPPAIGGTPGGDPNATGTEMSSGTGNEALWPDEVEKAARLLGRQREPRYPDVLRGQRVEGRVVVSYVVDSLGRVEPGSVKVVESAHPLFEPAVRQAVMASRFRPAEWRGRTVRQLVQQAFVFTLTR